MRQQHVLVKERADSQHRDIHPEFEHQLFPKGKFSRDSARAVVIDRAVRIDHDMRRGTKFVDHRGHIRQRDRDARRDRIRDIHRTGPIQRGEQGPAVVQVADQGLHPGFAQPLGAVVVGAHQRPHEPARRLQPLDHPGSGAAMAARRSDDQHRFLIACRRSHAGTPLPESGFKTQGRTGWVALSNSATMGS